MRTFWKKAAALGLERMDTEFETLFQQHWTRVCETLYRLTGDMAEADDLALEVFMRLYRRPPSDRVNLAGWLYRIAMKMSPSRSSAFLL